MSKVRPDFDLDYAIQTAVGAHWGQCDKQGAPYILHPLRVMLRFTDLDDQIVAVLHDVIEDTPVTLARLAEHGLPPELVNDLDALTKRNDETYTSYLLRCGQRGRSLRIKLADLDDNLSRIDTLTEKDIARLRPKYEAAKLLLRSIAALHSSIPRGEEQ